MKCTHKHTHNKNARLRSDTGQEMNPDRPLFKASGEEAIQKRCRESRLLLGNLNTALFGKEGGKGGENNLEAEVGNVAVVSSGKPRDEDLTIDRKGMDAGFRVPRRPPSLIPWQARSGALSRSFPSRIPRRVLLLLLCQQ